MRRKPPSKVRNDQWREAAIGAGRRIREARKARGMTLTDLAAVAEIDKGALSRIEHGQKPEVSTGIIIALCRVLRLDPVAIWGPYRRDGA